MVGLDSIIESRLLARAIRCEYYDDDLVDMIDGVALDHGEKVFRRLPKRQRAAANLMFRSIARSITDEKMTVVRGKLLRAVRNSVSMPAAKRQNYIRRVLGQLGVYGDQKSVVQTVTRTQASIADNAAIWISTLMDPNVWGYEYVARPNARPGHAALNGVRYPKTHKFWKKYFPPNGWNCHCLARPIRHGSVFARTKPFSGVPDVDPGFRFNAGVVISGVH